MDISIVVPIYNEEENIPALLERLRAVTQQLAAKYDFEFLFTDDGSTDRSAASVADLHASDPRVKLVSFSRNFGYQMALTAGLDHSSGDAVVIMDGDLQHPPSLLPALLVIPASGATSVLAGALALVGLYLWEDCWVRAGQAVPLS